MIKYLLLIPVFLCSCTNGEYILMSRGEAGLTRFIGASGQYCKILKTDKDYKFTEADMQQFYQYCPETKLEAVRQILQ